MLGTILIIVLILLLIGALPRWGHSANCGYGPSGILGVILVVIVILLLLGRPTPGSLSALLVGLVAGLIQAGFTVIVAVMQARIYVQLAGGGEAQASVPSSGT